MPVRSFIALLLLALPASAAAQADRRTTDPADCPSCEAWNRPRKPFRIHGNTWYVGTEGLSAVLVTSPRGHVLLDGGLPESAPRIVENIRALGFLVEDVRLIVNSHAHYDHAGGIGALQRASGASVTAHPWSARVMETGRSIAGDPQLGLDIPYPAVSRVRVLGDGDTVRVGDLRLVARFTPGHTPGSTTWTWRSCDGASCVDVVYADSQTPVSADDFLYTRSAAWPTAVRDFERGIATIEGLACDILVTPHPSASGLFAKLEAREKGDPRAFIAPDGCRRYAANARLALKNRIDGERARSDSAYIRARYTKRELRIPMRDGVHLHTVVYAPTDAGAGARYPILLQRTPFSVAPYGDSAYAATLGPDPFMLRDGYVFVMQEVRGRYRSEGAFENVRPLLADSVLRRHPRATDERTDAWDTIAWLLRNVEGHDRRVGLYGASYGGFYAAHAALSRHPAIVAASLQAPVADFWFEDFHHNGALLQAHLMAFPVFGTPRPVPTAQNWWVPAYLRAAVPDTADDFRWHLALGPLRNVTSGLLQGDSWWRAIVGHPDYDAFWRARALPPRLTGLTVPTLVVGGWYDGENLYGTLAVHRALRQRSPRAPLTFVMGPWSHRAWSAREVTHSVHGDLWFGDSLETVFQREVEAPFFRAHLRREGTAPDTGALVFDTGHKRWLRLPAWPAPAPSMRTLHLHADGALRDAPPGARSSVAYTSDPRSPVPARCRGRTVEDGGIVGLMSGDVRCFTGRPDVATFVSAPLREDLTVAGEAVARLVASTTGTDADVVVKLVDVYPDDEPDHPHRPDTAVHLAGYQQLVRGEVLRGRYRRSFSAPEPFTPGTATPIAVRLPDVLHTFRRGHRIAVHVQGSWFPLFDRNPGRFVRSIYEATDRDFEATRQRIHTGPGASRIELTVLP